MTNKTKEVDGVKFTNTHYGQKRAYGDSMYEYEATSERPADEVLSILCEHAYKCNLPIEEWKQEVREGAEKYFRSHYEFKDLGNSRFFYRVTFPYTD
jgi:hypothetical protein